MGDEIPVMPRVEHILIHTGNSVSFNRLKKNLIQSPTEELTDSVSETLKGWLDTTDRESLQHAANVRCINDKFVEPIDAADRSELKITVKLFMYNTNEETLRSAVNSVLSELGISSLETFILSLATETRDNADIKRLWAVLEEFVDQGKIDSLGIADLLLPDLTELYNSSKVKPIINQITQEVCCATPPDLANFAKEHQIQLGAHSDPKNILPVDKLRSVMSQQLSYRDAEDCQANWVARYSVLVKTRGVIKMKGYVVDIDREFRHYK